MDNLEKILIESVSELRDWLLENHAGNESVWIVRWKKEAGKPFIGYDEIVDQLICFGWIDSLPRKLDDQKTMLRISPRNPKSNWSRVNKERVTRLHEQGLMHPAGISMVEQARKYGSWNFLDDVEALIIPSDLAKAFKKYEQAEYYFERFPDSSKRNILEWIKNAKLPTTRKKRIDETALKASMNMKANHPKGRDAGPL